MHKIQYKDIANNKDNYEYIGDAYKDMLSLKEEFQYYQKYQEQLKKDYNNWPGPPESFSKEVWESSINEQMWHNRVELKYLEKEIKNLRKIIKQMNKEQNAKFNKIRRHP